MKKILSKAIKNLNGLIPNTQGATVIEYVVLAALIILVCVAAISNLGSKTNYTFSQVNSSLT